MRLSTLIGLPVRTESGTSLGHVHDVRAEPSERELLVTGLAVGKLGLLERLGLTAPGARERVRGGPVVPWASVVRADRRGVVVREHDGERPSR
jgi:sporulation protein YlmC with PRC-barrel domain